MLKRLARRVQTRRLRALRGEIARLRNEIQDLTSQRSATLGQISALRAHEPGMLKRFAASARQAASIGIAVAGGIAAYQLGQDSGFAGQMASNAVGDNSFALADAIQQSAPRTVAEYDARMKNLKEKLAEKDASIAQAKENLAERTAALVKLRATSPVTGLVAVVSQTLLLLIAACSAAGLAAYLFL